MRERVPMTDFARQWAEHVAASASPRKPRVPMASRSYSLRILLVAWRRKAVSSSPAGMPQPSSVTRI